MGKLTAREAKILRGIALQDGQHTARKVYRIFWVANDAYKVVFALWWRGLIRAPWLRLFITEAGRRALQQAEGGAQ